MASSSNSVMGDSNKDDRQRFDLRWDFDDPFGFGLPVLALDHPSFGPQTRRPTQGPVGKASESVYNQTHFYPQSFPQTTNIFTETDTNPATSSFAFAFSELDQMGSNSLDSLFDSQSGLDDVGTDFSIDMGHGGVGMDVGVESMGKILNELSFGVDDLDEMRGIEDNDLAPPPFPNILGALYDPDWLATIMEPEPEPEDQESDTAEAENVQVEPLAEDNNVPPQNGLIVFPPRDEFFPLPNPPLPATSTANNSRIDTSLPPSFYEEPLASCATQIPGPKLIWPIPVDKNGVPDPNVLRALKLPKYKPPVAHLSQKRAERRSDNAQSQDLSRISQHSVGAHSPYAGVGGIEAPTRGPTTDKGKGKSKAPDADAACVVIGNGTGNGESIIIDDDADADTASSSSSLIAADSPAQIGDKSWHVSTAPEPDMSVSETLAQQTTERRLARFSRKRDGFHAIIPPARPRHRRTPYDVAQSSKGKGRASQPVQDFEFQRMVVEESETVRVVAEKPAWGKPVKPWTPPPEWIEEANMPAPTIPKIGEGERLFVKIREPAYSRSSYGWAIAQIHDHFSDKYLILSGPHALTVRTVRPYDRLPWTPENFEGLRSGGLKKKDDRFYPEMSDEHAAIADHIDQVANLF